MAMAQKESVVVVDKNGIMRWSDTGKEASFFGVNYTLPFAHAYRATGYLGVDRKKAIDRDVYHFARLGLNAYRIHIWDVEISNSQGNLIENDNLDLLDYLIGQLKKRNIRIMITAQTNFGNGYPERNQSTGGFSYNYDKCSVHSNTEAVTAQERYLTDLVTHINPYTGIAYMDDPFIVGFEINNEPCHSGTQEDIKNYINRMLSALKKAGNMKPVFYNVSQSSYYAEAYYSTAVQGTTYQWYPTGLVAGFTRKGNFLPYVDQYTIPFSKVKGFDKKARMVYEFDPADIMYSFMYPAIVRTFRKAGFQWITQFAYDPIDIASYNTEYQTHFINLAYTPNKAISLKIAGEAARRLPINSDFGKYPKDTLFGDFRVSYQENLSELITKENFFYSNNTKTMPADASSLQSIAGCGSSSVVNYEGTGAYFIDRLDKGVWRLEVMPDAVQIKDPFAKPSLKKEVVKIFWSRWDMIINLPDLGETFTIKGIDAGNRYRAESVKGKISSLKPGVYLLQQKGKVMNRNWTPETTWGTIRLNEFVAPSGQSETHSNEIFHQLSKQNSDFVNKIFKQDFYVVHQPNKTVEQGKPLIIEAVVAGNNQPDSVLIYTDRISFWNDRNPYVRMKAEKAYTYRGIMPGYTIIGNLLRYYIVVFKDGNQQTFPAAVSGSPLDWDFTENTCWTTVVVNYDKPIQLFSVTDGQSFVSSRQSDFEVFTMPKWSSAERQLISHSPIENSTLKFVFQSYDENPVFYLRKYIREEIAGREDRLRGCTTLCIQLKEAPTGLKAGFITTDGFTYSADCPPALNGLVRLPVTTMKQGKTALLPLAYPVFLDRYFQPDISIPFRIEAIESLEVWFEGEKQKKETLEIGSIWLE